MIGHSCEYCGCDNVPLYGGECPKCGAPVKPVLGKLAGTDKFITNQSEHVAMLSDHRYFIVVKP